jgi:hypothetical protein
MTKAIGTSKLPPSIEKAIADIREQSERKELARLQAKYDYGGKSDIIADICREQGLPVTDIKGNNDR